MIVQIFFKDILKDFFFHDVLDGRHFLCLYSHETGLDDDIEIFIDVNNGVRHINEKNIAVLSNDAHNEDDNTVIEFNKFLLAKIRSIDENIGILAFENSGDILNFKKYMVNEDKVEIGKRGQIKYNAPNGFDKYFVLSYENSKVYVIPYINKIYCCGRILREKRRIRFGDIICYNKFKLIYMGNIIAVNNPDNFVECSLQEYEYEDTGEVRGTWIKEAELEEKKNMFTRSPRITHKPITEVKDIDPPTNKKEAKEKPLIYTIGPSFTMSMAMVVNVIFMIRANSSGRSPIPSAMMAASMLMGAVLWPILTRRYNKKQAVKDEEKRVLKYKEYIDSVDKELEEKAKYNREIYEELYPSLESLIRDALKTDRTLWNHTPEEEGFLDVRIGRGARKFSIDINIQKERFTLEDDPLKKYASVIQNKYMYLHNVPVSIDLNSKIVGIIGEKSRQIDIMKIMMTRLFITHCYDEVKLAVIYNSGEKDIWEFAKWLPHFWSDNRKIRFIADDKDGAYYVMSRLREIYDERLESGKGSYGDSKHLPHYIVFITSWELANSDAGIQRFIENKDDCGFTFVLGYETIGKLPSGCQNIIQVSGSECTIYNKSDNSGKMLSFVPDICTGTDINKVAGVLSSVRVSRQTEETAVPERLSFLGLYKAKNIEDLVIERRWKEAQSFKTLEAPIGMGSGNEVFSLNIHEKYHGPHGLIAGTTGSGKSEFIQSLILSMAINYHPYDVSFVLIDYKGGGMANAFANLPHVSGTITNLEGNQIKRSLISLKSELKRRQAIFKEYKVNHIDSYQIKFKRGLASEPLPHLVLISDEFAELKSQEPEFMSELISTARIGRSLGVHLILATQKPSGVVNDQIWSNTRFRICLKVADKTDSKEMLKREEAAFITQPGRCYVQIGNDEIFKLIQSGYSGEKYIRNGSNISEENNVISVSCIDLQGNELYRTSQSQDSSDTEETQLSAIVDYIAECSKKQHIVPLKLWLPSLPKELYLEDLDKRIGGFNGKTWDGCFDWLDPIIGLYDEPEKQRQDLLDVNFGQNGHFILYGAPGTGKTTFLQTLIYSLAKRYSPELVNMYVLDFGSRSLSYSKFLPHVADVIFSDDEDRIKKLFMRISDELAMRKRALAEFGVGNLLSYMQASKKTLPAIMIIIDNFAAFIELYANYESDLIKLSREGGNYGIYLVITSASVNAVKRRIAENVKTIFTLQLNDVYDYAAVLGRTEGVYPENTKGRGLARVNGVLEFHTALAVREVNEAERVKVIKDEFSLMAKCWHGPVPKPLPVMPENMDIEAVLLNDEYVSAVNEGEIPIGYNVEKIELESLRTSETPVFNIFGERGSGKTNMLADVIKTNKDREIWLIDNSSKELRKICRGDEITSYCGGEAELHDFVQSLVNELLKRFNDYKKYSAEGGELSKKEYIKKYTEMLLIIDDFDNFFSNISNTDLAYFNQALNVAGDLGASVFVSLNVSLLNKYKGQCKQIFDSPKGIVLGSIDNLSIYNINVPYAVKKATTEEAGKGYLVNNGKYTVVKIPSAIKQ